MKTSILIFVCLFMASVCFTQTFTEEEQMMVLGEKAYFFANDIDLSKYKFDRDDINLGLVSTVQLDKQSHSSKIWGFGLLGVGLTSVVLGAANLKKSDSSIDNELNNFFFGSLIAMGVIEMGVSIPLFNRSKKKAAQRDVSLQKTKDLFKGY
ncbi:MAG: hypothetical protein IT270_18705 [Saprospiraceae bacterium]|nr:hypothetical protein [Saprospiraceae bacterium]